MFIWKSSLCSRSVYPDREATSRLCRFDAIGVPHFRLVQCDECDSIESGRYQAILVLYASGAAVLVGSVGLAAALGLLARRWPLFRTPISIMLAAASLAAIVLHTRWAIHYGAGWSGAGSHAGIERFTAAVGVGLAAALMAAAFLSLLAPRLTAVVPLAAVLGYVYLALPLAGRSQSLDLTANAGANLWLALAAVAGSGALAVFHLIAGARREAARSPAK